MTSCSLTLLGTGTSDGIPMLGCSCPVCTSEDPRNRRSRTSAAVRFSREGQEQTIIIDTGLDFRQQLLTNKIEQIDAILYTHSHADHVEGITELRPLSRFRETPLPCYGSRSTITALKSRFSYVFSGKTEGGGLPNIQLFPVRERFALLDKEVEILPVMHGRSTIYGYRLGDLAFITDASSIPHATMKKLAGVRTLIINALRYTPHSTHFSVEEAVRAAEEIGARETRLVHLSHKIDHHNLAAHLPPGILPGKDGETLSFNW